MKKKYRRRYIVDGHYQMGQLIAILASNIMTGFLIGAFMSWFYFVTMNGFSTENHQQRFPVYLVLCIGFVGILSIYFSFRRSRSVAGMMEKIHQVLEDASKGEFPDQKVSFRRSDYFRRIETPLNTCLEQLRTVSDEHRPTSKKNGRFSIADIEKD